MDAVEKLSFPWPIMRVVLEGMSILDVPRLQVRSMEEATNFISAYGFNPNDTEDLESIWSVYEEAISFLEKSLADPQFSKVPEHLRTRKAVIDIRRLLLICSEENTHTDQIWACAILRIMHVLIHLQHDPRLKHFDQVQNQVLNRLDNFLYVDPQDGATYLGTKGEGGIRLLFFKKKDRKDREREIVKLLHKADNLVEEIYDRIGFRLVTETKFDAIRVVTLILQKNIVSLPNIRPGRSRNRLIEMSRLQSEVDRIQTALQKNPKMDKVELDKMFKRLERRIGFRRLGRGLMNVHSSEFYRAIQFTCRELVRVNNPTFQLYSNLKTQLENLHGGLQVLHESFPKPPKPYEYVFFPFEIQIMDVKGYADSIFGKSNHEEYRRKQLDAARNRVFGRAKE